MKTGEHIMLLRKQKGLSQSELGRIIGTSGDIIGRYERETITPSIEVVIKLADALEVSIDYLVGKTTTKLDNSMMNRIAEITNLPEEEKKIIYRVLDALLRDYKIQRSFY